MPGLIFYVVVYNYIIIIFPNTFQRDKPPSDGRYGRSNGRHAPGYILCNKLILAALPRLNIEAKAKASTFINFFLYLGTGFKVFIWGDKNIR